MMVEMGNLWNLEVTILVLLAAGYIMTKCHVIDEKGRKVLTNLVIDFVLPCNIIESFCIDLNREIVIACLGVFVVSILIQGVAALLGQFVYPGAERKEKAVLKYATMVSNAGFLGNPIVMGLYGNKGLLYASIYLIPQRILMWSYGITCFDKAPSKKEVFKRLITHPCIIAVMIGLVLMIGQISLPDVLMIPVQTAGKCTTALSMIVIGSILSEVKISGILTKKTIWFSIVRLVVFPVIVFVGCRLAGVDEMVTQVSAVLAGMPAATTTALLADRYEDADEKFAVKIVFMSTVLSIVTIPIMCIVMGNL